MKDSEIFKQRLEEGRKKFKARRRAVLFQKWILTIVVVAFASIPSIAFFLLKGELNPQTFWEKFAVWGVGTFFFGWLQIVLGLFAFGALVQAVWKD